MEIKKFIFIFVFLFFGASFANAKIVSFSWSYPYSQEEIDIVTGFNFYHTSESLVSEDGNVDYLEGNDVRGYSLEGIEDGWVFYFVTAVSDTEQLESVYSTEIILKFCESEFCIADFQGTTDSQSGHVFFTWEEIPSIGEYVVEYKKGEEEWVSAEPTSNTFFDLYDLEEGGYTFRLFAKDAQGRLINMSLIFPDVELEIGQIDPPDKPVIRVDSQGFVTDQTLMVAFDYNGHPDPYVHHYRVNVYSTRVKIEADIENLNGDILQNIEVPYGENFCEIVPFSKEQPIFYVSAVAVDYDNIESEPAYGYRLIGDNINRDVEPEEASINNADYQAFINDYNTYSQNPYELRSSDFCGDNNLYDKLPRNKLGEGSDYNGDGYVDRSDYQFYYYYLHGNSGVNF